MPCSIDAADLDGDGTTDSVTDGTTVSSWTDKSSGGETITQSNTDLKPTRQANSFGSKPAVRFDGQGDLLAVSSIRSEIGGYSVYASVRRPNQMGDTNGHLVSESSWSLIPDGSNAAFPAIVAKNKGTSGSLTNLKLGKSSSSTTNDFGGDLGELLIFTRELNSTEEQKVEGYLAHKWGATNSLDFNHPYKTVAPIFDNKPLINLSNDFIFSLNGISGLELWDANDDSSVILNGSNVVSVAWSNKIKFLLHLRPSKQALQRK